ncbi:MAG: hypothetical protein G01um10148_1071 [Parcubacteria group bacterium Gr01-1014_8]|nr:MAG: hypothetical protein G01um10148_1071 [Parcubacteria group bacterium Gr01-1014_8]
MMNLYQRNKFKIRATTSNPRQGLLVATFLILVVIGADVFMDGAIRSRIRPMLVPVASFGRSAVAAVAGQDFWSSRQALLNENESLRERIEKMEAQNAGFEALRDDYEALQKMMAVTDEEGEKGLIAPIASSFRASPYGTFIIGAGFTKGVREGDIVLSEGGFVLGAVSEVNAKSSLVRMVFAPGQKTEVVSGSTGFTISGRGGGNASAEVPREAALAEGAPVRASIYEGRPIGIIGNIESASSSAYAEIHVVFPINLNTVRYVYIVPGNE